MPAQTDRQWLIDILDERATKLYRLAVLLGADAEAGTILRSAFVILSRRGGRLIDPLDRVEFLQEHVVHQSRSVRANRGYGFPSIAERRGEELLQALRDMPSSLCEILVVSHYLSAFGPQLAGAMRMTVSGTNKRLEEALEALRGRVGEPAAPSMPGVLESLSQELAAALTSAARLVAAPSTEKLKAELLAQGENRTRRVSWYLAAPLLGLAMLGGVVVSHASVPEQVVAVPEPSVSTVPVPTASRSLPARVRGVPVYYLGREDNRLYRESRNLASTGDLVVAALDATLAVAPQDPDYRSAWSAGRVLGTELVDGLLTVDLSADAFEGIETAAAADQASFQMIYTASELLGTPDLRVRFRSEGGPPPEVFEHHSEEGEARRGLDPMPSLWVTSPRNNQSYEDGQFLITGTAKPSVDAVMVTIIDTTGATVMASAPDQLAAEPGGSGWRQWSLSVTLEPGTYTIRAAALTEPSDPLGDPPTETTVDTKIVTVDEE